MCRLLIITVMVRECNDPWMRCCVNHHGCRGDINGQGHGGSQSWGHWMEAVDWAEGTAISPEQFCSPETWAVLAGGCLDWKVPHVPQPHTDPGAASYHWGKDSPS